MHKKLTVVVAVAGLLTFAPALASLDGFDGAAFANNGNGNGNGNGNAGGNGNDNAGGNGKPDKAAEKSSKATGNGAAASGLGKMNGALHASINAVIAHINNGQTTNGPVALMAGLAIADAGAAAAAADLAELEEKAAAFDDLDTAVTDAGYASVEDYLQAKADGTATEDEIAAIDPLIDAVGGTTDDGLALAETAPTDEEIAAAEDAAAEAEAAVDGVEAAIGEAWNKDGDLEGLLGQMRDRLAENADEISAALAALEEEEVPEEE